MGGDAVSSHAFITILAAYCQITTCYTLKQYLPSLVHYIRNSSRRDHATSTLKTSRAMSKLPCADSLSPTTTWRLNTSTCGNIWYMVGHLFGHLAEIPRSPGPLEPSTVDHYTL